MAGREAILAWLACALVPVYTEAAAAPFFREVDRRADSVTYVIWVEASDLEIERTRAGTVYRMEGGVLHAAPSARLLPRLHRHVEVPEGCDAKLRVRALSTRRLEGWVPPRRANDLSGLPRLPDDRSSIHLGPVALRGGRRIAVLNVDPLREVEGGLELLTLGRLQIDFPKVSSTAQERSAAKPLDLPSGAPGYTILVSDPLAESVMLDELAQWRTRRGFNVTVTPVSEVGADPFIIKDWITSEYERGTTHVLFVGDDPEIPVFPGGLDPSEHWYTTVGGYDLYSDVALGRFAVSTVSDLDQQIETTLDTERGGGTNLETLLMVASKAGYPGRYTAVSEAIVSAHQDQPVQFTTLYGGEGATNADVQAALGSGAGILNYRGYGGPDDWQTWAADDADFTGAEVVPGARIVLDVACDNGWIDDGEAMSLAEEWMQKGRSAGVLASLRRSYTAANDALDEELFRLIFDEKVDRAGALLNRAREFLFDTQGDYGSHNARIYLWLGDPDAPILVAQPTPIEISIPGRISNDRGQIEVTVTAEGAPVEGATVTLSRADQLLARAETDSLGRALPLLPDPLSTGPATVAVTGSRILPVEKSVLVFSSVRDAESAQADPAVD